MIIFHRLQGSLVTYFLVATLVTTFLFTLVKFDIYPWDVTNSCVTNRHTNLAYLGLTITIVAQDGTGSFSFNDVG